MELSPEAGRFLPLVKSIASQTQKLVPDMDPVDLMHLGLKGLSEGFEQFRSRQGLTLRTYLTYRIRAAIYMGLAGREWASEEIQLQYLFLKKANELLLNLYLSAEGAIKRSLKAEEEEILDLLRFLAVVALLSGCKTYEIQLNDSIQELDQKQQDFIHYYYNQDFSLGDVSEKLGLSHPAAFRFHLQILENLASRLSRNEYARVVRTEGLKGESLTAKVVDSVLKQMFGKDFPSSPDATALRKTVTQFLAQDEHLSSKINSLISRLRNKL